MLDLLVPVHRPYRSIISPTFRGLPLVPRRAGLLACLSACPLRSRRAQSGRRRPEHRQAFRDVRLQPVGRLRCERERNRARCPNPYKARNVFIAVFLLTARATPRCGATRKRNSSLVWSTNLLVLINSTSEFHSENPRGLEVRGTRRDERAIRRVVAPLSAGGGYCSSTRSFSRMRLKSVFE